MFNLFEKILAAVAVAATTIAGFLLVKSERRRRREAEAAFRSYRNTSRSIDHADVSRGNPADDREWLRNYAQRKRSGR